MSRFHPLKVKEVRKETSNCKSISFEVPEELSEEFQFIQGQYLTLRTIIDGEEVRRSYSLCTSPRDGDLRVAVKEVPGGVFSTYANRELKAGDTLEAMSPMGNFYSEVKPDQQKDYVAFAAGSGITPIMSIMKTVLEVEPKSTFTLFFGNKYASSVIFKEEIEGLKNRFLNRIRVFHFFSREISDIDLFHGRLTKEKCQSLMTGIIDPTNIDEYFLCGPEEMIFSVKEALEEAGVESKKIHFELFTTGKQKKRKRKQQKVEDNGKVCEVFIKDGGNSFAFNLPFDSESILDAALSRGADLPFACKGGVCSTCKAKITEGKVEMEVNYALEPEEVEAGFVLTCQSYPTTDKVVVDFDEAL